jgi:putative FmdB family regulatory protein
MAAARTVVSWSFAHPTSSHHPRVADRLTHLGKPKFTQPGEPQSPIQGIRNATPLLNIGPSSAGFGSFVRRRGVLPWRRRSGTRCSETAAIGTRRIVVALYEYRCNQDGVFDESRPLGTAPESVACPLCGAAARRVISVPMVRCGSRRAWAAAIEHADKSRYQPEVVTSLPSAGTSRQSAALSLNPALRHLPRP